MLECADEVRTSQCLEHTTPYAFSNGYAVSTTKVASKIQRILDKFLVRINQLTPSMDMEAVQTWLVQEVVNLTFSMCTITSHASVILR